MMEEREIQLDISKKYNFPKDLSREYLPEGILIIAPDTANWLLMKNQVQERILDLLLDHSIQDVLHIIENSNLSMDDLLYVLTEIEAKRFESTKQKELHFGSLHLYLTNRCNLRCKHCYMLSGHKLESELNFDEIHDLLKEFHRFGGNNLILSGGEITERDDLRDILSAADELCMTTTLLTNGTQWPDDLIDFASNKIAEIQISIDGYDEISNASIRGKGQFQRAYETVRLFYEKGVRITIAVTPIYPFDEVQYVAFGKHLMKTFPNDNFNLKFSYELIEGRDAFVTHIDNEKYRKRIEDIVESIYPNNKLEKFALNHKNDSLFHNCGYGSPTITANGDVYFCNRISELKCYGNIRSMNFYDIVELSSSVSKMSDVDNLFPCNTCNIKYICGGGCRIVYVPSLVKSGIDKTEMFQRHECTKEYKESIYKKMIAANEYFYW